MARRKGDQMVASSTLIVFTHRISLLKAKYEGKDKVLLSAMYDRKGQHLLRRCLLIKW